MQDSDTPVLQALPVPVATLDAQGVVTYANPAWRARHDPAAAWTGAEGTSLLQPSLADGVRQALQTGAEYFSGELACRTPQGEAWVRLRVVPTGKAAGPAAVVTQVDLTERSRLARELARLALQSERRERLLQTLVSTTTDFTYAADRHGRVVHANDGTLALWGVSLEEARGKTVFELGYPQDLAQTVQAQIARVFRTGERITGETAYVAHDGTAGYYEYQFSPAFGPDGSVELMVGCTRDISERKRAEQALNASIAEFRALTSAMPQVVWVLNADGACTYVNRRWSDYTGQALGDALGDGWLAAVHPADRDYVQGLLPSNPDARAIDGMEMRVRQADGSYRWWLSRSVPVRNNAGQVLKWIGTSTDIHRLKVAEAEISRTNAELERQRHELRTVFDLVPALIWMKDTRGRVVSINERAAAAAGCSVQEAVGRHIGELFPKDAEDYRAEDASILESRQALLGVLERQDAADGSVQWFRRDKVPCVDANGSIFGLVVMKRDITEEKRTQDALRELNASLEARVRERTAQLALTRDEAESANRAKSAFLATMSHEIRTPMSGLLGLLELLELSALDEEQRSTLRVARDSGKALTQIIDGLLVFARIESGSLALSLAPASVRATAERIARLHGPVAANKGVRFTVSIGTDVEDAYLVDDLRLGQVLNNFVSNAVKFTPSGSIAMEVRLAARESGRDQLEFSVRDTGIGIAPDRIPHLFRPFAQASADVVGRYGGTGLGLFVAKRLAELMAGTIRLESAPGVGTTLTLRVPLEILHEGSRPETHDDSTHAKLQALVAGRPARPPVGQAELDGTLLLVVDDHPVNRMLLLRQVSTLGYAAEAAVDGAHALKAWESGRFAAIITDCSMPKMDGYEMTRRVRAAEALFDAGRIPIIGCTADASLEARMACADAGMDAAIIKPVGLEELSGLLDRYLPLSGPSTKAWYDSMRDDTTLDPAADAAAPMDLRLASEFAGNDIDQADVLAALQRANAADARALRDAAAQGHLVEVARLAHRLRGACAMVGANALAEACRDLTEAAQEGNRRRFDLALATFEHEAARLDRYLARA